MKVFNYMILIVTLCSLLAIAGISTGLDGILTIFGLSVAGGATTSTSTFWNAIFGSAGILIGIGTGIIIGAVTRSTPENFIILPLITGTLGLTIDTFVKIINYSKTFGAFNWVYGIVFVIFGALMVGYVLSMVEFFRGTD